MKLNIHDILYTYDYEVMNFYLKRYNNNNSLKPGKHISNPFLDTKQKTPSFNIYQNKKSKRWIYKDFATGDTGNCIELVKKLFNLSFKAAVTKIKQEVFSNESFNQIPSNIEPLKEKQNTNIQLKLKSMSKYEIEFWNQYGIHPDILEKYSVFSLSEYYSLKGKVDSKEDFFPIFAYNYGTAFKLYFPLNKESRFLYYGPKSIEFVFGFDLLPLSGELVIITGGEKDVLSLAAHGYNAICLNSETARPTDKLISGLKDRFTKVCIFYDNDETGIKNSQALSKEFDILNLTLPKKTIGKDISDFFKNGGTTEILNTHILETISNDQIAGSELIDTPYLSSEIYGLLPNLFKDICKVFIDQREKDMMLIGSLVALSETFSEAITGEYDERIYRPNLYALIIGPQANGKGVLNFTEQLVRPIHKAKTLHSSLLKKKYEQELSAFNKRKNSTSSELPERPKFKRLFLAANSSAAAMIDALNENDGRGLIFDTETDTLSNILTKEWGSYSDLLRKAFMQESYMVSRKQLEIEMESVRLSVLLSGTPAQLTNLIEGAENGLFSRFIYYYFNANPKWRDVSPKTKEKSPIHHIKKLSITIKNASDYLENKSYEFSLSDEQWADFNKVFAEKLMSLAAFEHEITLGILKRMGLIGFRIAMLLSLIRQYKMTDEKIKIICHDSDYKCMMILITDLLKHSINVLQYILKINDNRLKMDSRKLFDNLPTDILFKRSEAILIGLNIGMKDRTIDQRLKEYTELGLLEKDAHGKYIKKAKNT